MCCNPAKRLQQQQDQLQHLVDAVNNNRPTATHDTTIMLPGRTVTNFDTLRIPGTDSTRIIVERITTTTHDTIKIISSNMELVNSARRELDVYKSQYEGAKEVAGNYLKLVYILAACIAASIVLICILKFK